MRNYLQRVFKPTYRIMELAIKRDKRFYVEKFYWYGWMDETEVFDILPPFMLSIAKKTLMTYPEAKDFLSNKSKPPVVKSKPIKSYVYENYEL